jgi:ribonuclease T2
VLQCPSRQITGIGLEQYWINIKCPANNGQRSWKNAWKKAGACSGLDEKAYFEKALSFRSKINPLVRLKQNGKLSMFACLNKVMAKSIVR